MWTFNRKVVTENKVYREREEKKIRENAFHLFFDVMSLFRSCSYSAWCVCMFFPCTLKKRIRAFKIQRNHLKLINYFLFEMELLTQSHSYSQCNYKILCSVLFFFVIFRAKCMECAHNRTIHKMCNWWFYYGTYQHWARHRFIAALQQRNTKNHTTQKNIHTHIHEKQEVKS